MFRGRSSSGRAPPCQGGGSEFEPRRPLHCKQDIRLGVLFFVRRKNSLPPPAPKAHLIRGEAGCREASSGLAGERLEQGASEARKRPGGAFAARCACHGTAVPRASLVARSKKEVTTYVVTSFLDSGRKLKCSGEVNSPSAKVLLRKTLVRRKSVVFCFGRPDRYGTSELGVLFL